MITWGGVKVTATDFARFAVEDSGGRAEETWAESFDEDEGRMTPREHRAVQAALDKMTERMRKALGWYPARDRLRQRIGFPPF